MSILLDYLVTDAYARSGGAIDFPAHFIEGYAYLQDKFYGDRPGKFYDHHDAILWMPRRLLRSGSVELNYLTARGADRLYIALTNQSPEAVSTVLTINPAVLPQVAGHEYRVSVLGGGGTSDATLRDGALRVTVPGGGLLAVAVDGLTVTPKFQQKLLAASAAGAWKQDYAELPWGRARAMVLNFGPAATTAYVYLRDDDSKFKQATLTYHLGGTTHTVTDSSYPFEFTVPLPPTANEFSFQLSGVTVGGATTESGVATLRR